MTEPTISEEAVEAALDAYHRRTWSEREQRAMIRALTAAEPLMHERCEPAGAGWRALEEAHAENARLREALELHLAYAHGWRCPEPDVQRGKDYRARIAALAPTTPEGAT